MSRRRLTWLVLLCAAVTPVAEAQLVELPLQPRPGDRAGSWLAVDGDLLAVGLPGSSAPGAARVQLLRREPDGAWTHVLSVTPPPDSPSEYFGARVALRGRDLVIADPAVQTRVVDAGLVHAYRLDAARERVLAQQTLAAPRPQIAELFGEAIALGDDLLAVGASGSSVWAPRAGAVYVYGRRGGEWQLLDTVAPPQRVFQGWFGAAVAWSAGRLLVGAPGVGAGSIQLYERAASGRYEAVGELGPPQTSDRGFGRRLVPDGETVWAGGEGFVVPLRGDPDDPVTESRTLRPPRGSVALGTSIAVSERWLVLGDDRERSASPHGGRVRVYRVASDGLEEHGHIPAPASEGDTGFGVAVALMNDTLLIGASAAYGGAGAVWAVDASATRRVDEPELEFVRPGYTTALATTRDGRLWIGSPDGLELYDGYGARAYAPERDGLETSSRLFVIALHRDRRDRLWVGTEDGLYRVAGSDGDVVRYPLGPPGEYPRESVVAILEADDGTLWTGSNGRLYRFDEARDRFAEHAPFSGQPAELDETYVSGIEQAPDGTLWVLAKNLWENRASLYRLAPDGSIARHPIDPAWGQVGPLLVDSGGAVWIKAPRPANVPAVPGEPIVPETDVDDRAHWAMLEDSKGQVWIGSTHGFWLGPRGGPLRPSSILPQVEGRPELATVVALAEDRDGAMLMGHREGVFRAHGDAVPVPPALVLTRIEVLGERGSAAYDGGTIDEIELAPEDYSVAIEYAVVRPRDTSALRYRHRLAPIEEQWIPTDVRRFARYTNLAPGDYTFHVEALPAEGSGASEPIRLAVPLHVAPRWWQTTTFRLLLAALAVAGVGGLYSLRRTQQRRLTDFRIRVANDLHDDLSTSLSGVALATRVLEQEYPADDPQRGRLQRIATTAEALTSDLRDIVWLVDPDRDTARDLVQKMRTVADTVLAGVPFEFHADGEPLARIDMLARRQVLLVYKEALHNIARHAEATAVRIRITRETGHLMVQIRDDGRGFDPEAAGAGGHGLSSMLRRAERLGGDLSISSRPGDGTRVELRVRLG